MVEGNISTRGWQCLGDLQPNTHYPSTPINCGSGLAREGGVSVPDVLADTPPSRASPLPHFFDRVEPLEGERQLYRDLLALRQAVFELRRVMNQHILTRKRLSRDQA
jgi:hypothetical protein